MPPALLDKPTVVPLSEQEVATIVLVVVTCEGFSNGSQRVTGSPIKFPNSPPAPATPAPRLGEHTRLALREVLGMDDIVIDALAKRGVI